MMKLGPSSSKNKKDDSLEPSWLQMFQQAARLHQNAVAGDMRAARQAVELLEQVRTAAPDHNLALAYYGSALCLLGRDLEDNVERCAKVIQGLKHLNQAVANEPDNFEIRMIRGNVCVNLPEMYFHQNATAIEDFQYLITCYERYPNDIPPELYFQFLYNLSIAYHNLGQTEASESVRRKLQDTFKEPQFCRSRNTEAEAMGNVPLILQPLPQLLEEAEKIHRRALSGDKRSIQEALDFFAKARMLHADQPLFKAYYGDCLSLQGRNATNIGEMFANAIKAAKMLDEAVAADPDNVRIRFIRAHHSMRLPEVFFARTATAVIDWEYLAGRYREDPQLFTKEQLEEILFQLGICYHRLGLDNEAEEIWKELLFGSTPETRNKIEAHRRINLPPGPIPAVSFETDRAEFYKEAKRLHDLGVAGNSAAARMALELWEKAHAFDPADPVAQGYYGSAVALTGRDATGVNAMFGNAIKGLKLLNEALGRDPENWELRLLRGYLSCSLPEAFFHTTHQAIEDFQFLKSAYEQNNGLFPPELYDRILNDLQSARQRMGGRPE